MTTIHVIQFSSEAFDPAHQATADFDHILDLYPDGANFTEVTTKGHRDELIAAARRRSMFVHGGIGDCAIVTPHTVLARGAVFAHTGGTDSLGRYGARDIPWVTVEINGEQVTFLGAHWPRIGTLTRRQKHRDTTDVFTRLLLSKSKGSALAFGMGDLNEDDEHGTRTTTGALFEKAGLVTVYDELSYWPTTGPGGGTIDTIVRPKADTRVKALTVITHAGLNTDHRGVSSFWRVS